jgi:hypothetical protein
VIVVPATASQAAAKTMRNIIAALIFASRIPPDRLPLSLIRAVLEVAVQMRKYPPFCMGAGQIPFTTRTVPIWEFCAEAE